MPAANSEDIQRGKKADNLPNKTSAIKTTYILEYTHLLNISLHRFSQLANQEEIF